MGDFLLRRVSSELNATPAQEKALREVLGNLRDVMSKNRDVLKAARGDVARTLRSESFSEEALAEAVTRHDEAHDALRKAIVDAIATLYGSSIDARHGCVPCMRLAAYCVADMVSHRP